MTDTDLPEIVLRGIGASPGICIGKAYIVDKEGVDVVKKYRIMPENVEAEKNRFKTAVGKAQEELKAIIGETPREFRDQTGILETHIVLLKDKMLYGKILEMIEKERFNAEWALKKVVSGLKTMFHDMTDPYFRERAADIVHVSDRILTNLTGADGVNIRAIDKRVILVATDLSPAETSQIQLERIKGFVTDHGGVTSHTGIIARTLEIPAVLGLHNATHLIKTDDLIVVDGSTGSLIVNPSEKTLLAYEERSLRFERHKAVISRVSRLPAQTTDGTSIKVMGNIELLEEVVAVRDHGGNGIGLYRTEFDYMSRSRFPSEEELFDKYRDAAEVMAPFPVTFRTLDINGDKVMQYAPTAHEANPVLGLRAIRYCLKNPEVFKAQLRAILRAAAYGNVRIMFPMISMVGEIRAAKIMLREAADSLERENIPFRDDVSIGMMVEVPSAVIMADVLAKEVDFFSIGTNDLIQYTLAMDRGNRHVAHLYKPLHPAIIRMIHRVAEIAHNSGIEVYICGEMAGDPLNLPILLGLGMDELSMNPQSIPVVKNAIRQLELKEVREFVKEVLKNSGGDDSIEMPLREKYEERLSAFSFTHPEELRKAVAVP